MNLEVLYEDNHCLAVNKPAGLPSQGDESARRALVDRGVAVSQGTVRQTGKRLRRAGASARSADVRRRAARQDEQGRGPAGRAVPRGHDREGLLGHRGRRPGEDEGTWIDRLEKDRRINRSRTLAERDRRGQGGECRLPRAGALAGFVETGVAALDRAKPSAQGAAGKSRVADRGRREIWGEEPDRWPGRRREDRAACQES